MKTDKELIADFWGYKFYPEDKGWRILYPGFKDHYYYEDDKGNVIRRLLVEDMRFDISWNWFMPLYDKAKKTDISDRYDWSLIQKHILDYKLTSAYNEIVEFVKWYNKEKGITPL